eukprot:6116127-Pleurochrysis_carterae.AAC.2
MQSFHDHHTYQQRMTNNTIILPTSPVEFNIITNISTTIRSTQRDDIWALHGKPPTDAPAGMIGLVRSACEQQRERVLRSLKKSRSHGGAKIE